MNAGAFPAWCHAGGLPVGQASSAAPATPGVALRGVHECGGFLRGAILRGLPVGQASSVAPAMHGVALRGGTTVGLSWRGAALGAVCWPGVVGGRSHAWRGSTGGTTVGFSPRGANLGGCLLVRRRRRSQPRMAWLYAGSMTVGAFLRGAILCGLRVGQASSAVPATRGVALRGAMTAGGFPAWCHPVGCLSVRRRRRPQPRMAWLYAGGRPPAFPRRATPWVTARNVSRVRRRRGRGANAPARPGTSARSTGACAICARPAGTAATAAPPPRR